MKNWCRKGTNILEGAGQIGVDLSGPAPADNGYRDRLVAVEEEVIAQCICIHKVEILQIRHELIKEK